MTALPEGVHGSFTHHCTDCGGMVTVIQSTTQPHACRGTEERDNLAVTLNDAYGVFYEPMDWHESTRIAAAILAAGWRPPTPPAHAIEPAKSTREDARAGIDSLTGRVKR